MLRIVKFLSVCLVSVFLISSCSSPSDIAVEYVEVKGNKIPKIHVEKIQDQTEIKLTDWYEDIRLIPLESTEESLFSYPSQIFVGLEYIVVSTFKSGILLFDANGGFIRILAPRGKGPGEVKDANRNIFVDDKNHQLYVTDMYLHPRKILRIGIKTGIIKYIDLKNTGGEFAIREIVVRDDSLMICTTMQYSNFPSESPLFCQTTSGNLLWELNKVHPLGLQAGGINLVDEKLYFYYLYAGDTIFGLENNSLKPIVILNSNRERAEYKKEKGSIRMKLVPLTENLFKGSFSLVTDAVNDDRYGRKKVRMAPWKDFIFNRKSGKAQLIGKIKDDYWGGGDPIYMGIDQNGVGIETYQAIELLEMADSVINLPEISKKQKSRLEQILQTVDENDNPYLLVGKLKEL